MDYGLLTRPILEIIRIISDYGLLTWPITEIIRIIADYGLLPWPIPHPPRLWITALAPPTPTGYGLLGHEEASLAALGRVHHLDSGTGHSNLSVAGVASPLPPQTMTACPRPHPHAAPPGAASPSTWALTAQPRTGRGRRRRLLHVWACHRRPQTRQILG